MSESPPDVRSAGKGQKETNDGPWAKGDKIEYYSASSERWIRATVVRRLTDGRYDLTCKNRAKPSSIRSLQKKEPAAAQAHVKEDPPPQQVSTAKDDKSSVPCGLPKSKSVKPCKDVEVPASAEKDLTLGIPKSKAKRKPSVPPETQPSHQGAASVKAKEGPTQSQASGAVNGVSHVKSKNGKKEPSSCKSSHRAPSKEKDDGDSSSQESSSGEISDGKKSCGSRSQNSRKKPQPEKKKVASCPRSKSRSKSQDSGDRWRPKSGSSKRKPKCRSRSRSGSGAKKQGRSPSSASSKSQSNNRNKSSSCANRKKRNRSPKKTRSRSRVRKRSASASRQASCSSVRKGRSRSGGRRRSRSRVKRRSRSVERRRSRSRSRRRRDRSESHARDNRRRNRSASRSRRRDRSEDVKRRRRDSRARSYSRGRGRRSRDRYRDRDRERDRRFRGSDRPSSGPPFSQGGSTFFGGGEGGSKGGGKGISGEVRPGDWQCPGCGINVFASKSACFKCGTGRDGNKVGKGEGKGGPPQPDKFSTELWEEPRENISLKLISEIAPPSLQWNYVLKDDSRRSYAAYMSCPFTPEQCTKFFEDTRSGVEWKQPEGPQGPIPRKTAWMVSKGCCCTYRYGSIEVEPQEFPPWMVELMQSVMPLCGFPTQDMWPTSCNLNLYEDGGMSVGWHSDDESLFQGKFRDVRILSLSLGVARRFELRANWPGDGERPLRPLMLGNGDLCTMEGMTQKHFQHRVPKENNVQGPRINLTWRWVLKHTPRCPAGRMR